MNNILIAKRYAQALIQIGQEQKALEKYEKDLELIIDALINDKKIKETWFSQSLATDAKTKAVKDSFKGKISDIMVNFLCLLVEKHREEFLVDIFVAYKQKSDELRNIVDAEVISAVEINEEELKVLKETVSTVTGKTIRLHTKVNPELIGGLSIQIGDRVIDGSVKSKLNVMKEHLKNVQLSEIGVRD